MKAACMHTIDSTQMAIGDTHIKANLRESKRVLCPSERGYADAQLTTPSMHIVNSEGGAIASMRSAKHSCNAHRSTPLAARLTERLRTVAPPNNRENALSG